MRHDKRLNVKEFFEAIENLEETIYQISYAYFGWLWDSRLGMPC